MATTLKDLLEHSLRRLLPGARVYIAYSGGLDSQVLLHLAARLRERNSRELVALHVNHGLSPHAGEWQAFCETQCTRLAIKLRCRKLKLELSSGNLEQQAREARYTWFEQQLEPGDFLLMAHHRDDQAETVLLRLMRGSGVRGLTAIPDSRVLGKGQLLRPLLDHDRSELLAYAEQQGLSWIEDESNYSTAFDRNYIRHRVIPVLMQRWPQAGARLAMSSRNCREDQVLLDELAESDIQAMQDRREPAWLDRLPPIALQSIEGLSSARQRNVLNYALRPVTTYPVPVERLNEWLRQVMSAAGESSPRLQIGELTLVLYDGWIHCVPRQDLRHVVYNHEWKTDRPLAVEVEDGYLELVKTPAPECMDVETIAFEPGDPVRVHTRKGGERVQLVGEPFSRPLKKLFQQRRVAPWLRESMPMVSLDGRLAWSAVLGDFAPRLVDSKGHFYSFRLICSTQIKSDS